MSWPRIVIIVLLVLLALTIFDSWDSRRIAKREAEKRYGRAALDAAVRDATRIGRMNERALVRECLRTRCLDEETFGND